MDIAALSTWQSQTKVLTAVNIAVLDMNLDTVKKMGDSMIKMMEQSVTPHLGQNIDIRL
ncbi:MAG: Motility protein [Lachnoclostridium sp.]|jgi:hypothetical protein